jgi:hypothetical protein
MSIDNVQDLDIQPQPDSDSKEMISKGLESITQSPASFPQTFFDMFNLIKLIRGLGLYISDSVSFDFRMDFSMLELDQKEVEWKEFAKELPPISYYSEIDWKGKVPFLLSLEESVIYALTSRLLGTSAWKGDEKQQKSFAENFVGEEFVGLILRYFSDMKHDLTCVKTDPELSYFHTFYPDDHILAVQLKCNINQEFIGSLTLCLSKDVLHQG